MMQVDAGDIVIVVNGKHLEGVCELAQKLGHQLSVVCTKWRYCHWQRFI